MEQRLFVGLDVHKRNVSIGLAEDGRTGEVRFLRDIENTPVAVESLICHAWKHFDLRHIIRLLAGDVRCRSRQNSFVFEPVVKPAQRLGLAAPGQVELA